MSLSLQKLILMISKISIFPYAFDTITKQLLLILTKIYACVSFKSFIVLALTLRS